MIRTESGIELKKKLLEGIEIVNVAVSSTLGPSGRNVLIHGIDGEVRVTKDGATVAASISKLDDEVQNISAQLIKQVAIKTANKAGDGTTTATLLASTLVREGVKAIVQGNNPIEVKKGIDKAVKAVIDKLKTISKDVTEEDQLKSVASISANNDPEIGNLIATAIDKVGKDGLITIEDSMTGETYLDTVEGIQFERGYKSPFFITDNASNMTVLEDPLIFLWDGVISSAKQIVPALTAANTLQKPILIIADVEGEALSTFIVNKQRGLVKGVAVKPPEFGDRRIHVLEDIAIMTGGKLLTKDKGINLEKMSNIPSEVFGHARKVTVSKDQTTIIDGKGDEEKIVERIKELKTLLENAKSVYEIETMQNRLAKMTGGIAIIYVGGMSEVEMKEKKDRVEDALHATKAAVAEGFLPGGGMALINCIDSIDSTIFENDDQKLGGKIVKIAISEPFKKILANAGIENHYEILQGIKEAKVSESEEDKNWIGYNVKYGRYENFNETGVIDPTKVTRTALDNASSIAGTILTTESVIYLEEDKSRASNSEEF